ncbi:hypothetical protein [Tenacibaculum maritimum]|uniref:hypothetical protein n=1 Tax=Tenacibaculum maritimum TaxID=107401 RepID=UPI0012E5F9CD|nr:hypothetical protein [Tenacibaculum maritimum]MCD9562449.1 hypothetical protein [Tenacibaculum maritimum]MCD9564475.1 hypothetical protein [Tenacibaculum maritimum]MCD9578174.1 hypothetical protein [Tenacibaculum maritimum]MCD9595569.1 hypothetical protein [Tenacibaculum maritimum]MCD9612783.1 hypothetical protein [Tenacibaculum maritimum]
MNYKQVEKKYLIFFNLKYSEFINKLIEEVKKEEFPIDFFKYTKRAIEKPKEITLNFLISENIEDHLFTDNLTFSLMYSFYLEFISHKERVNLDDKLLNEITKQNTLIIANKK